MATRSTVLLFAIMLALPASPGLAGVDAATAETLMRDSGMWRALGEVPGVVKSNVDRSAAEAPTKPPRSEVERIKGIVDASFRAERLQAAAQAVVEKEMDAKYVAELTAWLASADNRAVVMAEAAAPGDQSGIDKLKREGIVLLEQMPSSRRDLLEDVLIASGSIETTLTIAIGSTIAAVGVVRRAYPDQPIPNEFQLRAHLEARRSRAHQNLSASFLEMYASIYKKISDAGLRKYENALSSPTGRHLTVVFEKAVETAFVESTIQLWNDILPADKPAPRIP